MSVPIELHVGDPPRTIYVDIVNLPETVKLGMTIRAFNYDDVGLYFQVTAQCSGWTFETVNLGLVGSGTNIYQNLHEIGSRAKPSSETEQIIKLILKAYTDAGYTDLKWTYERNVTIVFIKSDDPSYTVDELDNFDDGTVQGWAIALEEAEGSPALSVAVSMDYVLSAPYSLRAIMMAWSANPNTFQRSRIYKSFTTPNKTTVYAILDVRLVKNETYSPIKNVRVQRDTMLLVYLGRPRDAVLESYVPKDKWLRIVVPLPKNTTLEVRFVLEGFIGVSGGQIADYQAGIYMDDFKIISK